MSSSKQCKAPHFHGCVYVCSYGHCRKLTASVMVVVRTLCSSNRIMLVVDGGALLLTGKPVHKPQQAP